MKQTQPTVSSVGGFNLLQDAHCRQWSSPVVSLNTILVKPPRPHHHLHLSKKNMMIWTLMMNCKLFQN